MTRTVDRPSLTMRYLNAIGPGSVLCKSYATSHIRDDGSAQELIRTELRSFNFVAAPNAHFTSEDREPIQRLCYALEHHKVEELTKEDRQVLDYYDRYGYIGKAMIGQWRECLDAIDSPLGYAETVRQTYSLGHKAPVVVVGNPTDFLGGKPLSSDGMDAEMPELAELLKLTGYLERFQIYRERQGEKQRGILVKPQGEQPEQRILPPKKLQRRDYDVGLVYLGREQSGRILVVAAGTNAYGTFAAVDILCDAHQLAWSEQVAEFISGRRNWAAMVFETFGGTLLDDGQHRTDEVAEPNGLKRFQTSAGPYSSFTAIDRQVRFPEVNQRWGFDDKSPSRAFEIECRRLEQELAKKAPERTQVSRQASQFVRHFEQVGPVAILCKAYPADARDDEQAKDLIQRKLTGSLVYPVPDAPPLYIDPDLKEKTDAFLSHLKASTSQVIKDLQDYDPQGVARIRLWQKHMAIQSAQEIQSIYSLGKHPTIVLGEPTSFLGFALIGQLSSGQRPESSTPEFRKVMDTIGYPNRFVLDVGDQPKLFDRLTFRTESLKSQDRADEQSDVGLIYLSKGPEQRDTLVIAGTTHLGTLAGAELLFERRIPSIGIALQQYIDGKRQRLDIAFRCRRIQRESPAALYLHSHPPAELEIQPLDQNWLIEFRWSHYAEKVFRPLWQVLDSKQSHSQIVPISESKTTTESNPESSGSSGFQWEVSGGSSPCIRLTARHILQDKEHIQFLSQPTFETYRRLREKVAIEKAEWQSFLDSDERQEGWGFNTIVVGPTGVGKEHFTRFFANEWDGSELNLGAYDQADKLTIRHFQQLKQEIGQLVAAARGGHKLIQVSVPNFTVTGIESELAGIPHGRFTEVEGAIGQLHRAGSALFNIDEFLTGDSDLQKNLQSKLLRILDSNRVKVSQISVTIPKYCPVLASTTGANCIAELEQLPALGKMLPELLERFSDRYELLPLCDRPTEILPGFIWWLNHFWKKIAPKTNSLELMISRAALKLLLSFDFPRNFRQLRNVAKRLATITQDGSMITAGQLRAALYFDSVSDDTDAPTAGANDPVKVVLAFQRQGTKPIEYRSYAPTDWPKKPYIGPTVSNPSNLLERVLHVWLGKGSIKLTSAHVENIKLLNEESLEHVHQLLGIAQSLKAQSKNPPDELDKLIREMGDALVQVKAYMKKTLEYTYQRIMCLVEASQRDSFLSLFREVDAEIDNEFVHLVKEKCEAILGEGLVAKLVVWLLIGVDTRTKAETERVNTAKA